MLNKFVINLKDKQIEVSEVLFQEIVWPASLGGGVIEEGSWACLTLKGSFGLGWIEFECGGIDAVAQSGGCGTIVKDVAEVGTAAAALDFGPQDAQ